MPADRPRTHGFTASSASRSLLRPLDYFLIGICIVALIAVGVVAARGSSQAQRAEAAERSAKTLNETIQDLQSQVQQLRGDVQSLRGLNGRLSTLESRVNDTGNTTDEIRQMVREVVEEDSRTRQAQFRAEMDRRGEEFMNRLTTDKRLEQGLRQAVDRMRQQTKVEEVATAEKTEKAPEPPPAQKAEPATQKDVAEKKAVDPVQENIAQGAEKLAEGLKLWRDFQEGKITREQFDAQRKGLEDDFRATIEKNMTPEQREELQRRIQEWRGRRQGGGGAQKPPQPIDEKF